MNTTGALVLAICTAVLSGLALFAQPVPVHWVLLDVIFLLSTAMALVIALHMLLKRLATTADLDDTSRLARSGPSVGAGPATSGGMSPDSHPDHDQFTARTHDLQDSITRS